jgi:hypothetical protein
VVGWEAQLQSRTATSPLSLRLWQYGPAFGGHPTRAPALWKKSESKPAEDEAANRRVRVDAHDDRAHGELGRRRLRREAACWVTIQAIFFRDWLG